MTKVDARPMRKQKRRQEVIDAAAKVFYERGYDAATIQDIADELGILKGSVYHYIDAKDDLLFAVMEDPHRRGLELVEQCRTMQGSVVERLEALLRGHVAMLTENHIKWALFVNHFGSLSRERRDEVRETRRSFEAFLTELLEEGRRSGELRSDLDAPLTTLAILGMVNWASRWYRADGTHDPAAIADRFLAFTLDGVRAAD